LFTAAEEMREEEVEVTFLRGNKRCVCLDMKGNDDARDTVPFIEKKETHSNRSELVLNSQAEVHKKEHTKQRYTDKNVGRKLLELILIR
jgi:hypothetical protein